MTSEERISKLESELSNLKEELKRNRKANVWKRVKDKFTDELNSFNWTYTHNFTNYKGDLIEYKNDMCEGDHISQAIGTIVRVVLQRKGLNYLENEDEEKATNITKKILEIMINERKV